MNEEYDEIPACLGSAKGGVHVLATAMPVLDKTEHGLALDNLANFLAGDSVLTLNLLDDRIEPDGSSYLHPAPFSLWCRHLSSQESRTDPVK